MCEALDRVSNSKRIVSNDLPSCSRDQLLKVDVTRKHNGAINLPGIIPLYIGMPVVLREKNISTDLGVTNGATGTVRHLVLKPISVVGERAVVDVIFVHFESCPVQLQGLPKGVVPLIPVSSSFKATLQMDGKGEEAEQITRYQLCVQPGFAITGHSAQGRTLRFVICNLCLGGFGAYVAASRPRDRGGLALTKEVSVNELNVPLPTELVAEDRRLSALAHNTKLRFGFGGGSLKKVKPLKGLNESALSPNSAAVKVSYVEQQANKRRVVEDAEPCLPAKTSKKHKRDGLPPSGVFQTSGLVSVLPHWLSYGCNWLTNFSCAYDTVLMSLLVCYEAIPARERERLRTLNAVVEPVCSAFSDMLQSGSDVQAS